MRTVVRGDKFGDLTVTRKHAARWSVQCVCRRRFNVDGADLLDGRVTRCQVCVSDLARFERGPGNGDERRGATNGSAHG